MSNPTGSEPVSYGSGTGSPPIGGNRLETGSPVPAPELERTAEQKAKAELASQPIRSFGKRILSFAAALLHHCSLADG